MQYFVYIGRHNKTIELFSKLSTGVFYAAPNCYKATKVLDKIREKYDAALFIEQVELSKDIADIRSIRKMYPGLYMVLVIDSITKEEATEYLKAGVNNTIKYETNSEVLKDLSTFLTRRKEQKIEAEKIVLDDVLNQSVLYNDINYEILSNKIEDVYYNSILNNIKEGR